MLVARNNENMPGILTRFLEIRSRHLCRVIESPRSSQERMGQVGLFGIDQRKPRMQQKKPQSPGKAVGDQRRVPVL